MKQSFLCPWAWILTLLVLLPGSAPADDLPGNGFAAAHYEALWSKSPFAVASSDTAAPESPDYGLVGIAEFDGISYASLIDKKKNNEHFLLSSDQELRGLKLMSVTRGKGSDDTLALIQKDGQPLTLKLEVAAPNVAANVPAPQIPMPGSNSNPGISNPPIIGTHPPGVIFRPRPVHFPPQPGQAETPGSPGGTPALIRRQQMFFPGSHETPSPGGTIPLPH